MTRKEVCAATGLSIKTLRLYEEKGLITPERQYRNGREYRIYTPELVAQLQQIATLRRALFTMEEIKTMQQHPETIPGIFQDYRQWLESQEQQFHALRQAADQVAPQQLLSVNSLLSGMKQAAETMPLPRMDIKPDFKRIDAMEEPPRHVIEQTGLDDMVPNARVFRQMNLVVDRDRSNNVNIAFGQYNDLRNQPPEESGPVQEAHSVPRWQKILGGMLTVLTLLVALLGLDHELAQQWFDYGIWGVFLIVLLLRLLLAAVPLWQSHRQWQKDAQQKDADAGGSQYLAALAAEKKRRKRLIGLGAGSGILVVVLIVLLCRVLYTQAHPQADYSVCLLTTRLLNDRVAQDFSDVLSPLVGDLDGNGTALCTVDQRVLVFYSDTDSLYMTADQVADCADQGTYSLLLLVDYALPYLDNPQDRNAVTALNRSKSCAPLPEDIPSEDGYLVDLSQVPALRSQFLGDLGLYACIPVGASQADYDTAVSLLSALLQTAS